MDTIDSIISVLYAGGLASAGFILFSVYNWTLVLLGYLGKTKRSLIPLIGGLAGIIVMHAAGRIWLWWLPLLLDPGCFFLLSNAIWEMIKNRPPQVSSSLNNIFLKPPKLSEVETIVLDNIVEKLPAALAKTLRAQIKLISKIQRLDRDREVDFYYLENRDPIPKFTVPKDVCEIAKISMKSENTGHEAHATVLIVKGVLFSINFDAPPNDLRNEQLTISTSIGSDFHGVL